MKRFLVFALPLLLLLFASFHLGLEVAGFAPELGSLTGGRGGGGGLPPAWIVGTWAVEALGLCTLYLLVTGTGAPRLSSGLLAAWIAWLFRGPLLVVTAVGFGGLSAEPWWRLTLRWFLLYTLAGLLLGLLGVLLRRGRGEPTARDEASERERSVPSG